MTYQIEQIEGIGPSFASKLAAANIKTTDDLLEQCCERKGRQTIAETTGIGESVLLKWVNMADLMRVPGIGGEFAELLMAAGVDTVKELRTRNAPNLAEKAKEINEEKSLTRVVPSESVITGWINEAKGIDPKITH